MDVREVATPEEWILVGGNRIAIIRDQMTVRLAEFYSLYDGVWLPDNKNAALAVESVRRVREME